MTGIPKRLRQVIRMRRRVIEKLMDEAWCSPPRRVLQLARLATDLDRRIQTREWLPRSEFDPIKLGM